jgi:hypothetical protein
MTSRQSDRPFGGLWATIPISGWGPPVPFGCSMDELQVEAEKAMRELSDVAAKIAVELPK